MPSRAIATINKVPSVTTRSRISSSSKSFRLAFLGENDSNVADDVSQFRNVARDLTGRDGALAL
jgi:hypothetical protein